MQKLTKDEFLKTLSEYAEQRAKNGLGGDPDALAKKLGVQDVTSSAMQSNDPIEIAVRTAARGNASLAEIQTDFEEAWRYYQDFGVPVHDWFTV